MTDLLKTLGPLKNSFVFTDIRKSCYEVVLQGDNICIREGHCEIFIRFVSQEPVKNMERLFRNILNGNV
jgi:hypothetical protein